MTKKELVIDPPNGWKYGFPKIMPQELVGTTEGLSEWLVANGYPEEDLELALNYSRYLEREVPLSTEGTNKMKITIIEVAVHPEDESPVFGRLTTKIRLDDEGSGAFVKLVQDDDAGKLNEVRFDFKELEPIIEAIKLLEAGVSDETD